MEKIAILLTKIFILHNKTKNYKHCYLAVNGPIFRSKFKSLLYVFLIRVRLKICKVSSSIGQLSDFK